MAQQTCCRASQGNDIGNKPKKIASAADTAGQTEQEALLIYMSFLHMRLRSLRTISTHVREIFPAKNMSDIVDIYAARNFNFVAASFNLPRLLESGCAFFFSAMAKARPLVLQDKPFRLQPALESRITHDCMPAASADAQFDACNLPNGQLR